MKVRAKEMGFHEGHRYRAGATFEFKGKKLASWMESLDEAKPVAAPKAAKSAKAQSTEGAPAPEGNELI